MGAIIRGSEPSMRIAGRVLSRDDAWQHCKQCAPHGPKRSNRSSYSVRSRDPRLAGRGRAVSTYGDLRPDGVSKLTTRIPLDLARAACSPASFVQTMVGVKRPSSHPASRTDLGLSAAHAQLGDHANATGRLADSQPSTDEHLLRRVGTP